MSMTILATGINIASGAASTSATLPNASSGTVPYKVRVAVTASAHVRLGAAGVTAAATDTLVQPNDAQVFTVPRGVTNIAVIQDTAAGTVNVAPLEDC